MQNRILGCILVLIFVFTACDSNRVFDEYKTLPKKWHKDSIVSFNINLKDSINPYNLFVNIRNNNDYKFNNLFLIVEINFPHGKTIKDTLEYKMAKPNGELLGSGFTDVKENKLWYKEKAIFNESGDYKINLQHAMRENGKVNGVVNLEGVLDVGFRVEKTKN